MQRVMWHDAFCITPLKMSPPGARIDLARYGAWPAETTHTPRVPDMAVAAHRRARIIKQIFSVVAIAARAVGDVTETAILAILASHFRTRVDAPKKSST